MCSALIAFSQYYDRHIHKIIRPGNLRDFPILSYLIMANLSPSPPFCFLHCFFCPNKLSNLTLNTCWNNRKLSS